MKTEPEWADILKETKWYGLRVAHVNTDWMKRGQGYVHEDDLRQLMTSHGFQVNECKIFPLKYKFTKDFAEGFVKSAENNAFPELQGEIREKVFKEFKSRVAKYMEQLKVTRTNQTGVQCSILNLLGLGWFIRVCI